MELTRLVVINQESLRVLHTMMMKKKKKNKEKENNTRQDKCELHAWSHHLHREGGCALRVSSLDFAYIGHVASRAEPQGCPAVGRTQ